MRGAEESSQPSPPSFHPAAAPPLPVAIYLLIWRAQPGGLLTQQSGADGSRGSEFQARNNLMTCLGKDCSEKIPLRSRSAPCPRLRQSPDEDCDFPTLGSEPRQPGALGGSCSSERTGGLGDSGALPVPPPRDTGVRGCRAGLPGQGAQSRALCCFLGHSNFYFPHFPGFLKPFLCLQAILFLPSVFASCLSGTSLTFLRHCGQLMNRIYAF